jgi:hypothetical protein
MWTFSTLKWKKALHMEEWYWRTCTESDWILQETATRQLNIKRKLRPFFKGRRKIDEVNQRECKAAVSGLGAVYWNDKDVCYIGM